DRMALVANRHSPTHEAEFRAATARIRDEILSRAWNSEVGSFVGHYDGRDLDAALLQMVPLRFLPGTDTQLRATVEGVGNTLSQDGWLFRYRADDGFGLPKVAFVICTFWLVEALAAIGRTADAKALMTRVHAALSPLGLMSEDYETATLRMWGNFPQAYSHV